MKRSERDHRMCRECDVEVEDHEAYCAAHKWILRKWLDKSRQLIERITKIEREA